jgi:4-hydroxy-tetrahydrodipicolinate synthase
MAGGPVRLPLDELDEKKTEQIKKILATIPKKSISEYSATLKKPVKTVAGRKKTTMKKMAR